MCMVLSFTIAPIVNMVGSDACIDLTKVDATFALLLGSMPSDFRACRDRESRWNRATKDRSVNQHSLTVRHTISTTSVVERCF